MRYFTAVSWSPAISTNCFFQNSYPANLAPPCGIRHRRAERTVEASSSYLYEVSDRCWAEACEQSGWPFLCDYSTPSRDKRHPCHVWIDLDARLDDVYG